MRLIDADALEKFLADAEVEATKRKKYVLAGALNTIQGNLRNFPTTEPEPRWIPCSERLPEEYGNYLITTYDGNVDIGTIDPNGKSVWSACDADGFYWMRNVIAWMPLPEPYRAERRTDD